MDLFVDFAAIEDTCNQIETILYKMSDNLVMIRERLNEVNNFWEGDAYNAYKDDVKKMIDDFEPASRELALSLIFLAAVGGKYQALSNTNAKSIVDIVGTIFGEGTDEIPKVDFTTFATPVDVSSIEGYVLEDGQVVIDAPAVEESTATPVTPEQKSEGENLSSLNLLWESNSGMDVMASSVARFIVNHNIEMTDAIQENIKAHGYDVDEIINLVEARKEG